MNNRTKGFKTKDFETKDFEESYLDMYLAFLLGWTIIIGFLVYTTGKGLLETETIVVSSTIYHCESSNLGTLCKENTDITGSFAKHYIIVPDTDKDITTLVTESF